MLMFQVYRTDNDKAVGRSNPDHETAESDAYLLNSRAKKINWPEVYAVMIEDTETMTLEDLEKQAIERKETGLNEHSLHSPGQSDTIGVVTVFAYWKPDGRRTAGGYHDLSYVVGAWAGAGRWQALEAIGEAR